ncbi:MAG: carboxylesterase family protein [Clostridia bacterium]|nr:carboxylesterase family protein [Clostridia bacterium]
MSRVFSCDRESPVVSTDAGKIRGFQLDGTYVFQGIKYADAERFMKPQPVKPWEGVIDAHSYGYVCPLMQQDKPNGELMVPHRYWPFSEHCQYLNVWTQHLDRDAKKPVLVWLHGGGFSAGSSIEQQCYDGQALSEKGDVVVVSINHRLNILGYFDLSPFGEKYKYSANAGSWDMVAALQWIHNNIAEFGGDPENVTLFGQSGGGMKVWTLMNTPEADGLFHKGVIQSGLIDGFVSDKPQNGEKIVKAVMKELKIKKVEQLETIPYPEFAAAYLKVKPELEMAGEYVGCTPVPDDFYLGDPRVIGFTDHAKTIPTMCGTCFAEFAFGRGIDKYNTPDEEVIEMLKKKYRKHGEEKVEKLIELYKEAYPEKSLGDLLYVDSLFRNPSRDFNLKKAEHQEAPSYSYIFKYDFNYDGGKAAWHCSDLPFFFANTALVPVANEVGVTDELEDNMSGALLAFAKTGNPNYGTLPEWPACKPGDEAVMLFDKVNLVKHNFDHELQALHAEMAPSFAELFSAEPIQH